VTSQWNGAPAMSTFPHARKEGRDPRRAFKGKYRATGNTDSKVSMGELILAGPDNEERPWSKNVTALVIAPR